MSGKSRGVLKVILISLFVLGLFIAFYPKLNALAMRWKMHYDAQRFLSRVEPEPFVPQESQVVIDPPKEDVAPALPAEYTALWQAMHIYNAILYEQGQMDLTSKEAYEEPAFLLKDNGVEDGIFAVLEIPVLELEMPVYLGASKENMAAGAAVMGQTSIPLGSPNSNAVIAGHRGWNGAAYFLYLDRVQPGDEIIITNLWEELHYKVVDIQIISPYDIGAIKIQPGRELVTLLTCHPPASGGKQRYLVICERVHEEDNYGKANGG